MRSEESARGLNKAVLCLPMSECRELETRRDNRQINYRMRV